MICLARTVKRSSSSIRFTVQSRKRIAQTGAPMDPWFFRSAVLLALVGVGLQGFSIHKMVSSGASKKW